MKENYFDRELCKRFINDNNLPIPLVTESEKFFYYVKLYEELYGTRTLFDEMCDEIDKDFGDDIQAFLNHFYDVRDKMINDILENPKYNEFINADMNKYKVCDELRNVQSGNVYNGENGGKRYLSIDLSKANFQALKFFDKSLVKGKDTYEDYVREYTKSNYIINSKYTRQVVFGKCNAKRQITIERYLISKFYESFKYNKDLLKLVRFNNDELVFELNLPKYDIANETTMDVIIQSVYACSKECGVDVSPRIYQLSPMRLHSHKKNEDRNIFYVLYDCVNGGYEFKEVPKTYFAIVYKLYNNLETNPNDYFFNYEGLDAYIDDYFTLII